MEDKSTLEVPQIPKNRLRKDTPIVMPPPKLTFSLEEAIIEAENESDNSELADQFPTFEPPSFRPLVPSTQVQEVNLHILILL